MKVFSIYSVIIIFLIFCSNSNKINSHIFDGISDYLSNIYSGWRQEIVQSTKGYKDILSNLYELFRIYENNIYDRISDNSDLVEKMKNILKIMYQSISKDNTQVNKTEEEKGFFSFDFNDTFKSINLLSIFNTSKSEGELFVDGVFQSISSVPFEENKCYSEIADYKKEIVSTFENLLKSFNTGDNLINETLNLYQLIQKLRSTTNNCQLDILAAEILTFTNTFGAAKLAYRIFTNRNDLFTNILALYSNINSTETNKAGQSFGNVIKLIFNYSTK